MSARRCARARRATALVTLAVGLVAGRAAGRASDPPAVQEITEEIDAGQLAVYDLPNLHKGQTLYVYVAGTGGDFDPLAALLRPGTDVPALKQRFIARIEQALKTAPDPLTVVDKTADELTLVWNDDTGTGYDAAFTYRIPADGTYILLVRSTFARPTFGSYRLLVGLDAPAVLRGTARPTGARIAVLNRAVLHPGSAVREKRGTLAAADPVTSVELAPAHAGDTVYAFVEGTSGDLAPTLLLGDFGGKPLRGKSAAAARGSAALQYTFPRDARGYRLQISGRRADGSVTAGNYRLLVGFDAPEVLTGKAAPRGRPVLHEPIRAKIGVQLEQITGVDQRAENFGIVGNVFMQWRDRTLAFSPAACQCFARIFRGEELNRYVAERKAIWPEFTLANQQGNRWIQNRVAAVWPDGLVHYYERFSTTLQAPDFEFRQFPFDQQTFYIRIESVLPDALVAFETLPDYSRVGTQLGEEEWVVTRHGTFIGRSKVADRAVSLFALRFEARRHVTYYVFRIFLPLILILVVSWITFFLKDYAKRIDVAGGNLLLFVAFSFAIAGDLPRLGYITLMDAVLVCAFIVTASVVVLNVYLRRLELAGRKELAARIDRYTIWLFPVAYIVALMIMRLFFG